MTTTDPFTTPTEAQREARVKQAHDRLALAAGVQNTVTSAYESRYTHNYGDGIEAVRDALVGQGLATLAVNANLDRIATALETLADQVQEHAETVNDALGNVAEVIDRARWWQWRRRWFNRRQRRLATGVFEFRLDLHAPARSATPLASTLLWGGLGEIAEQARQALPSLCTEANVPADGTTVCGLIFLKGASGWTYYDSASLINATVHDTPEGGS